MNIDQDFMDWLKYPDAYSGQLRQEMLNDAYDRQDGPRVVAFFEGYLKEAQVTAPPMAEALVPAGVARSAPAKPPLSKFAAPGKGKSAAPSSPVAEKPVYTSAWITRFYADVAAGKWRGHEAQKAAIEQDIFLANSEGRVQ